MGGCAFFFKGAVFAMGYRVKKSCAAFFCLLPFLRCCF